MDRYHNITNKIRGLLKNHGFWYETFEHKPVRTSEEASNVRPGYTLKQGAKAIIVRVKERDKKYFLMLVLSANMRFDTGKLKQILKARDIRFASEMEVKEITGGVEPGGVPPFGNLFGIDVLVDRKLFRNEKIVFNAGDRRFSLAMKSADYKKMVKPKVDDFSV
jgi:Ala-tRNA(Pro) deacylase